MAAICFNLGIEAVGPYTCSISPAGTYNGKDYYIMVAPDCVTPYNLAIAPKVWTVWYSTGNGYVNQWVLSEGLNQYLAVQSYLPVSSSPDVPLGNWVIGPEAGAIDVSSTDTNCIATISITYTPNYEGCHRIYFRLTGNPDYCFYLDETLSIVGSEKEVVIELTVEQLECLAVPDVNCVSTLPVQGYIQPCCAAESDLVLRTPFTLNGAVTKCTKYTIGCKSAGIRTISIVNPGSGYSVAPGVTIVGSGGATATATISANSVINIIVGNPGGGYSYAGLPIVNIDAPDLPGGVQATAQVYELYTCGNGTGDVRPTTCGDESPKAIQPAQPGRSYTTCSTTFPINNESSETTISVSLDLTGCCSCNNYSLANEAKVAALVQYINCDNLLVSYTVPGETTVTLCMVPGSLNITKGYPDLTVTDLGACP